MKAFLIIFMVSIAVDFHAQQLTDDQKQKLDDLVNSQVDGIAPGLGLGIVQNGQIIYERYAGYANLEHEVPIDEMTRFNIASCAKQFTAFMILKLAKAGRISLNDDIRKFIPEIFPDYPEKITVAHLIEQSSGIRDFYNLMALQGRVWWKEVSLSNQDAIALLAQQTDLNFKPGSQHLYSNSNYVLLTEIVARVTDAPFAVYAHAVFDSLDMEHTRYLTNYMNVIPHKARPYANWGSWQEYPALSNLHGDGNLYSTLPDQLRWEVNLQSSGDQILARSQKTLDDSNVTSYGYGLEHDTFRGQEVIYHDGQTGAYNATTMRFPEENLAIVLLSNSGQVGSHYLAKRAALLVLGADKLSIADYPTAPEKLGKKQPMGKLLGRYESDNGQVINFVEKEGELFWQIGQNRPFKFVHQEGNLYAMDEQNLKKVSFHNESGEAYFIEYFPGNRPRKYVLTPGVDEDLTYFKALNGTYYNAETKSQIKLNHKAGNTYSFQMGDWISTAQMWKKDRLNISGYQIYAERDKSGKITALLLNDDRIRKVRYERVKVTGKT